MSHVRAGLFTCALIGISVLGESALARDATILHWTSENRELDALPASINLLVLSMHNSGALPTFKVTVPQTATSAERIMRTYFPLYNWTLTVDNVLCDLNRHHCSRPRVPVPAIQLSSLTSHASGFEQTPVESSVWSLKAGESLTVPRLDLVVRASWATYEAPRSGDFKRLYERKALGCVGLASPDETFPIPGTGSYGDLRDWLKLKGGAACPGLIAKHHVGHWASLASIEALAADEQADSPEEVYNSVAAAVGTVAQAAEENAAWSRLNAIAGDYRSKWSSPTIRLPVFALGGTFELVLRPEYFERTDHEFLGSNGWRSFLSSTNKEEMVAYLTKAVKLDVERQEAEGKPDSIPGLTPGFLSSQDFKRQVSNYLGAIRFPYDKPELFLRTPHSLIVIDDGLDTSHCVFSRGCKSKWVDILALASPSEPQKELFQKITDELQNLQQGKGHGHGIAAVATAKPGSGGILGMDPHAKPVLFDLNLKTWRTAEFQQNATKLVSELEWPIRVWNLSGHTRENDYVRPIYNFIETSVHDPLQSDIFVFAAGNETIQTVNDAMKFGDCEIWPACRTLNSRYKNVVTVVGAMMEDGVPSVWRDDATGMMSYTNPSFEIAAIAKDIPIPSYSSEVFYSQSGTSYAAPQVAAVVGQLQARLSLPPEVIVGRLVGCGRMSSKLEGAVIGGLLDVECTLRADKAHVAFRPTEHQSIDHEVAATLRPGRLLGVWLQDRRKADVVIIEDGDSISGPYAWWPEPGVKSLLGFRPLIDDAERFNFVVWDGTGALRSEILGALISSQEVEFLFDGDTEPTCIKGSMLLGFVPASFPLVTSARSHIKPYKSVCPATPTN